MISHLSSALRAAAEGIHPDEAATGLIISHGTFLHREDFIRHVETAACISDGTPMAWIDKGAELHQMQHSAPGVRTVPYGMPIRAQRGNERDHRAKWQVRGV